MCVRHRALVLETIGLMLDKGVIDKEDSARVVLLATRGKDLIQWYVLPLLRSISCVDSFRPDIESFHPGCKSRICEDVFISHRRGRQKSELTSLHSIFIVTPE